MKNHSHERSEWQGFDSLHGKEGITSEGSNPNHERSEWPGFDPIQGEELKHDKLSPIPIRFCTLNMIHIQTAG